MRIKGVIETANHEQIKNSIALNLLTTHQFFEWLPSQTQEIKNWVQANRFQAKPNTFCLLPRADGTIEKVLIGIEEKIYQAKNSQEKSTLNNSADFWALGFCPYALPEHDYGFDQLLVNQSILNNAVLAWGLGSYRFSRYKKPSREPARLIMPEKVADRHLIEMLKSIYLIRDLINTPTDDMNPVVLSEVVKQLAQEYHASFKEIVGQELLTQNYPAIYTVGRASIHEPRLLELRWGEPSHSKITLVGKGVCFDSGGLDIKNCDGMLLMKKDMGGAAHVIGLAQLIMSMQLPVNLRVLIPAVENAISGNAYHPGDIIKTRKGLTVEVGNTDAEGRLILADALYEATHDAPDLIIDFATLTGAARVALGPDVPVFFSNHEEIAHQLLESANEVQDPLWRLPLYQPYRDYINSSIADMNNVSANSYGGAITAALFLSEFVDKKFPWIHIDLMAWNCNDRPGRPQGGEAMAFRAMYNLLNKIIKVPL